MITLLAWRIYQARKVSLHPYNKLTRRWAARKLKNFLALVPPDNPDPEGNGGAIAAALANADTVAVYPMNCWGDLWHGTGHEDPQDGFARQGLDFARTALAWTETEFQTDPSRRFVWGTSAGGHGVAELVKHGESFVRYVADAPVDYLPAILNQSPNPEASREVARRIYEGIDDIDHIGSFSLWHAVSVDQARPEIMYIYSCNDIVLTDSEITGRAAQAILTHYEPTEQHARLTAGATDIRGHVFTNSALGVAESVTDFFLEGQDRASCSNTFVPCP